MGQELLSLINNSTQLILMSGFLCAYYTYYMHELKYVAMAIAWLFWIVLHNIVNVWCFQSGWIWKQFKKKSKRVNRSYISLKISSVCCGAIPWICKSFWNKLNYKVMQAAVARFITNIQNLAMWFNNVNTPNWAQELNKQIVICQPDMGCSYVRVLKWNGVI